MSRIETPIESNDFTDAGTASSKEKGKLLDQFLKRVAGIVDCADETILKENSNKNGKVAPIQRDLIAGEASKFFTLHSLNVLPQDVTAAIANNVIKFHDMDYFMHRIHNCCVVNLQDMLDNGTVLNKRMLDPPKNFLSACSIATQIVSATFTAQYGGTSISLLPLAKYLRKSERNYWADFGDAEIVAKLMQKELVDGI